MRRLAAFLCLGLLLAGLRAEVKVRVETRWIPTYLVGPDDPNPPLWNLRVYPYPMQTDITRNKEPRPYRVVEMENEYIKVLILPDVGGRILAAHDKTFNNFDFIYHNHVIKPGLVALRGAWLSGGIEWNFPTLGHTVNTFSPVNWRIIKNSDGSVTCVVGTEEWVRRMKWEVFITLYPGRSYFRTFIRLYNRTLTHNRGYFWANAAVHAWDDTRVIFPPTNYTYAGRRRNPQPWPIYRGLDRSWYKNTPYAHDYFCGQPGDFNGAYNYRRDCGTVHYAYRYESPGKKFWTWGTAPAGALWEKILTDEDGQYIEIQSGRLLTQGDTWIFEPHMVEQWEEFWYPIKKMGGFVKANPDAALNFQEKDGKLLITLNTTRTFEKARLKVYCGEKLYFQDELSITPAGYYRKQIRSRSCPFWRVVFEDSAGREVLSYTNRPPSPLKPELQPNFSGKEKTTVEETFLKGYYAYKHWDDQAALYYFSKALEMDPGFTPALRWLGILKFKMGLFSQARQLFEGVLQRNEDDHTARYYRALSGIRAGQMERVEEDLYMVGRRAAYRHIVPYLLASLRIKEGRLHQAASLLSRALRNNPDDTKAKVMLAAVLRHLGEKRRAGQLLDGALGEDPISPLAILEAYLQGRRQELSHLRDDAQYYLEASCDYAEMNLLQDALSVLKLFTKRVPKPHPLVLYYAGYYNLLLGRRQRAFELFKLASQASPDYVFPFRTETEAVLKAALRLNPSDWKAHYYLGNLLTAKMRWREGLSHFLKAASFNPAFSVLYRNIGQIYWVKLRDYERAVEAYEKAVELSPSDYRLYVDLDELYYITGRQRKREALFRRAPAQVKANYNYLLQRADYLVQEGRFEQALEILRKNTFLPWEGWTGAHQIYVRAHLERALELISKGKLRRAVEDIKAAMEYPENLGTGRPAFPVFAREYFLLGLCYKLIGKSRKVSSYFAAASSATASLLSHHTYYKALALKETGRAQEAISLLRRLRKEALRRARLSLKGKGRYYLLTAMAEAALGVEDEAEKHLELARREAPSDRWIDYFKKEWAVLYRLLSSP